MEVCYEFVRDGFFEVKEDGLFDVAAKLTCVELLDVDHLELVDGLIGESAVYDVCCRLRCFVQETVGRSGRLVACWKRKLELFLSSLFQEGVREALEVSLVDKRKWDGSVANGRLCRWWYVCFSGSAYGLPVSVSLVRKRGAFLVEASQCWSR